MCVFEGECEAANFVEMVEFLLDVSVAEVRDFEVEISAVCSGYEGVGLVVSFLAIYLWTFRSRLRQN